MKIVTKYVAEDGKEFSYEDQCLQHERDCANRDIANKMLEDGYNLADCMKQLLARWEWFPFDDDEMEFLSKVTKDTGFVVRHWQCSDKAGYFPWQLDLRGNVKLWGDVGCWSGGYGNWCSVRDLMRYAKAWED